MTIVVAYLVREVYAIRIPDIAAGHRHSTPAEYCQYTRVEEDSRS